MPHNNQTAHLQTTGSLTVNAPQGMTLEGAQIHSQTQKLTLNTPTLIARDLNTWDRSRQKTLGTSISPGSFFPCIPEVQGETRTTKGHIRAGTNINPQDAHVITHQRTKRTDLFIPVVNTEAFQESLGTLKSALIREGHSQEDVNAVIDNQEVQEILALMIQRARQQAQQEGGDQNSNTPTRQPQEHTPEFNRNTDYQDERSGRNINIPSTFDLVNTNAQIPEVLPRETPEERAIQGIQNLLSQTSPLTDQDAPITPQEAQQAYNGFVQFLQLSRELLQRGRTSLFNDPQRIDNTPYTNFRRGLANLVPERVQQAARSTREVIQEGIDYVEQRFPNLVEGARQGLAIRGEGYAYIEAGIRRVGRLLGVPQWLAQDLSDAVGDILQVQYIGSNIRNTVRVGQAVGKYTARIAQATGRAIRQARERQRLQNLGLDPNTVLTPGSSSSNLRPSHNNRPITRDHANTNRPNTNTTTTNLPTPESPRTNLPNSNTPDQILPTTTLPTRSGPNTNPGTIRSNANTTTTGIFNSNRPNIGSRTNLSNNNRETPNRPTINPSNHINNTNVTSANTNRPSNRTGNQDTTRANLNQSNSFLANRNRPRPNIHLSNSNQSHTNTHLTITPSSHNRANTNQKPLDIPPPSNHNKTNQPSPGTGQPNNNLPNTNQLDNTPRVNLTINPSSQRNQPRYPTRKSSKTPSNQETNSNPSTHSHNNLPNTNERNITPPNTNQPNTNQRNQTRSTTSSRRTNQGNNTSNNITPPNTNQTGSSSSLPNTNQLDNTPRVNLTINPSSTVRSNNNLPNTNQRTSSTTTSRTHRVRGWPRLDPNDLTPDSLLTPLGRKGHFRFEGVEFRGVRSLRHVDEEHLRNMYRYGYNVRGPDKLRYVGHHGNQRDHREPGAFMVEMPRPNHRQGDSNLHPYGNQRGLGIGQEARDHWDEVRVRLNKERARQELIRRGLPLGDRR